MMIPKKVFFTSGIGKNIKKLHSFEAALRDADIAQFNIVEVSSILPPNCEEISKEEGLQLLSTGQILFVVLSRIESNKKDQSISASIGVAKPKDPSAYGYISEHHAIGETEQNTAQYTEDLAVSMLASSLGVPLKSEQIIETKSITAHTTIVDDDFYATAIAAAVFILD